MNKTRFMTKRQRFRNWKITRPFWGATLALLSGLLICYVPLQLLEVAAVPGTMVFVGFFLGGIVLICAILSYIMPHLSTLLGIMIMFSAILSIMGAMGGFIIGTILGIIGGSLCISWRPFPKAKKKKNDTKKENAPKKLAAGQNTVIHK